MRTILTGVGASAGIAIGKAFYLHEENFDVVIQNNINIEDEIRRFESAVANAKQELINLCEDAKEKLGLEQVQIFEAHAMVVEDPELCRSVRKIIEEESVNAEAALHKVSHQFIELFDSMDNEYMSQRAADIRDVTRRVMSHLLNRGQANLREHSEPVIIIANDLTPSDTVQLDKEMVLGFATNMGGRTSHSAIIARSMGIPAVVGLNDVTRHIEHGTNLIIDGIEGHVIIQPSPEEIAIYEQKQAEYKAREMELKMLVFEPTMTLDGRHVEIAANIGTQNDIPPVLENGAEGVGLLRSEFLYMNRDSLPTEDEQFEAYQEVARRMGEKPVIIRTMDIGGDKQLPYLEVPQEMNPFLGYRAIRMCLDRPDMFKTQLRAILRASQYGNLKIMYPMISTLAEIRKANQILQEVKDELDTKQIPYNQHIEVGIMVEIPACALAADIIAREVDFFSIGTNDLVQYTMACDRMNEKITHLYQPYHPSVLRLIKMVIEAAHKEGKWVGMCGELAGDLTAIPILLGLGLDEFSMSASSVLPARKLIRNLSFEDVRKLAQQVLGLESQDDVQKYVQTYLQKSVEHQK